MRAFILPLALLLAGVGVVDGELQLFQCNMFTGGHIRLELYWLRRDTQSALLERVVGKGHGYR